MWQQRAAHASASVTPNASSTAVKPQHRPTNFSGKYVHVPDSAVERVEVGARVRANSMDGNANAPNDPTAMTTMTQMRMHSRKLTEQKESLFTAPPAAIGSENNSKFVEKLI